MVAAALSGAESAPLPCSQQLDGRFRMQSNAEVLVVWVHLGASHDLSMQTLAGLARSGCFVALAFKPGHGRTKTTPYLT